MELRQRPAHSLLVERPEHDAMRVDALGHAEAVAPLDQGTRPQHEEVVDLGAGLAPDLQHVAEALRGQQSHARGSEMQLPQ